MAVNDDMEAVFKSSRTNYDSIPDNTVGVDPESGNPVPLGATPAGVRDDIDARLSEGEMVMPQDVVNYYGIKFFEDLRAEAKRGYSDMAENGRIGGEPIGMETVEPEDDMSFDVSELEVVEGEESPEEMEMFFGGLAKALRGESQTEGGKKPYNRAEALMEWMRGSGKDDKPKREKPKKQKKKAKVSTFGSLQERAAQKYGTPEEDKPGGVYTPGMAEGGVADEDMGRLGLGAEGIGLSGGTGSGVMELREYRNDAGHTMMIVFVDGEPISAIPDGYYPVGDAPAAVVEPEQVAAQDDDDGGPDMPVPTPIDYQSLSMNEINEMVTEQGSTKNDMIAAGVGMINPLVGGMVKLAMLDSARRLENEIERRLDMDTLTAQQRSFYEGMLEKAQANKPGFINKILGKIKGDQPEATEPYSPEAVVVDPQSVSDAVAEAMAYDPTAKTTLEDSEITVTELPDPVKPNNKAGEMPTVSTDSDPYVPEPYSAPASEKFNKAGQGDSPTPLTDAFGTGNIFTSGKQDDNDTPSTDAMRYRRVGERSGQTAVAKRKARAIKAASDKSGVSIADIGRASAPSDETRDPDYNDPRRGMKKGGLASKKKK